MNVNFKPVRINMGEFWGATIIIVVKEVFIINNFENPCLGEGFVI